MSLTPSERVMRARLASHASWVATDDRSARTKAARDASWKRFETLVDPDGKLPAAERRLKADSARKMHYTQMAFKSAKARRSAAARKRA